MNFFFFHIQDELGKMLAFRRIQVMILIYALIGIGAIFINQSLYQMTGNSLIIEQNLAFNVLVILTGLVIPITIFYLGSDLMIG